MKYDEEVVIMKNNESGFEEYDGRSTKFSNENIVYVSNLGSLPKMRLSRKWLGKTSGRVVLAYHKQRQFLAFRSATDMEPNALKLSEDYKNFRNQVTVSLYGIFKSFGIKWRKKYEGLSSFHTELKQNGKYWEFCIAPIIISEAEEIREAGSQLIKE